MDFDNLVCGWQFLPRSSRSRAKSRCTVHSTIHSDSTLLSINKNRTHRRIQGVRIRHAPSAKQAPQAFSSFILLLLHYSLQATSMSHLTTYQQAVVAPGPPVAASEDIIVSSIGLVYSSRFSSRRIFLVFVRTVRHATCTRPSPAL